MIEQPLTCENCDKAFATLKGYEIHQSQHCSVLLSRFICDGCSGRFNSKRGLTIHRKRKCGNNLLSAVTQTFHYQVDEQPVAALSSPAPSHYEMQSPYLMEDRTSASLLVEDESNALNFSVNRYCQFQYDFYDRTFGVAALLSSTKEEFEMCVKTAYEDDDGSLITRMRLYSFGVEENLSRESMGKLLSIINDSKPSVKVPRCGRTLYRGADKSLLKFDSILEKDVPYPEEWEMRTWKRRELGAPPRPVHLRVRDPVQCIAKQLIDPELMLGYHDGHRHLRPYINRNQEGQRVYSDLMSSTWAEETGEMLGPHEILLPLILYSDGVRLNKVGNNSCEPAQGSLGIFSDEVLRKPSAKMCFGYIPTLDECFDESQVLMHLVSRGHKKTQAEGMIKMFYYQIRSAFWDLLIQPIRDIEDGIYLYVLGEFHVTVATSRNVPNTNIRRETRVYASSNLYSFSCWRCTCTGKYCPKLLLRSMYTMHISSS